MKYKKKKRRFDKTKNIREKKTPCGEIILIDIVDIVYNSNKKKNSKYLSIVNIYKNFKLNKLYYDIEYQEFKKLVKIIFPKYKNKRKKTLIIKVSDTYIEKIIKKYCYYISFNNTNLTIKAT